ncbi:hypothetical protein Ocin01_02396 [Orchesella cincta]|uniref:Secreted protein n=1 Tax=Orchesella cincta TaxID=48709 RepID=A0A1D2NGF4_ORCCI|nr:hypothetical protein Ocin01_02396 [Orchesella cincta]
MRLLVLLTFLPVEFGWVSSGFGFIHENLWRGQLTAVLWIPFWDSEEEKLNSRVIPNASTTAFSLGLHTVHVQVITISNL